MIREIELIHYSPVDQAISQLAAIPIKIMQFKLEDTNACFYYKQEPFQLHNMLNYL